MTRSKPKMQPPPLLPLTPTLPASPDSLGPSPSTSTRSTAIKENIQVMVRLRPFTAQEAASESSSCCWSIGPEPGVIELTHPGRNQSGQRTFVYDVVVNGEDNKVLYDAGIGNLVRSAMAGYNGTVFAYGQTASGKTYTMMGTMDQPGMIPRAIEDVFMYIEENPGREFMLRVSYMEIYKEKIRDLLADNDSDHSPQIQEDKKRGVYVKNLHEVIVNKPEQVMELIAKGEQKRHVGATDFNAHSSRSHTVFQMVIESRVKSIFVPETGTVRISQLNLIDLAGSEKATSNAERRKEGAYINRSLLALGNVISQLTKNAENTHVPYRDSILTRILQTALSGNARISVICTINPTLQSKDESLNTLRFAQRAKLVRTSAKMTRINEHSELQKCLTMIAELQTKMQEKTEQEVETRERLSHLLSLILTSSKNLSSQTKDEISDVVDRVNASETAVSAATMRDVFAQCERGLTAQREEMQGLQEALHKLQQTDKEKTAHIAKLERTVDEVLEKFEEQTKTIHELNQKLQSYSATIEEQKQLLVQQTGKLTMQSQIIDQLKKENKLYEAEVFEQRQTLQMHEETIEKKNHEVESLDKKAEQQERMINELERTIQMHEEMIGRRNHEVESLSKKVEQQERTIDELTVLTEMQRVDIERASDERRKLQCEIAESKRVAADQAETIKIQEKKLSAQSQETEEQKEIGLSQKETIQVQMDELQQTNSAITMLKEKLAEQKEVVAKQKQMIREERTDQTEPRPYALKLNVPVLAWGPWTMILVMILCAKAPSWY